MNLLSSNLLVSLTVFAIALGGGLLPFWLANSRRASYFFALGNSFARGIFLGLGFIHLLPEADAAFKQAAVNLHYPVISVICASTIIILLFVEQSLNDYFKKKEIESNISWVPYLTALLLSTHSILAGAALGMETQVTSFMALAFAMLAHKGSEGFALGMSMENHRMPTETKYRILVLFALMTPLGVLLGTQMSHMFDDQVGRLSSAIFNAIAAGTFIYIAMLDKLGSCNHCTRIEKISQLTNLAIISLGFALMALITHNHA